MKLMRAQHQILLILSGVGNTQSGWIQNDTAMRDGSGDIFMNIMRFGGGNNSVLNAAPTNTFIPNTIVTSQTPRIQNFINNPLPVMMVTTMTNVERSRTNLTPPNAIPSRPYLLHEPATSTIAAHTNPTSAGLLLSMQTSQLITIAEPMDFTWGNDRTMPTGNGRGNIYHGGSREVGLSGSFNVVKRRIPLTAPISLGSFENAIACGFDARYPSPGSLALRGVAENMLPLPAGVQPRATKVTMAKSIGNSWSNPFLPSNLVQGVVSSNQYHDQSWMANTALWDSWFLSGIVNPSSGPWNSEIRSQRQQFSDLAERIAPLRNARLTYFPHKSIVEALTELFDGNNLRPGAIDKLTKYLLVDGAFNVNSTSEIAWKAFLTSVREQEILDSNGAVTRKNHPFGTLGHAVRSATTGTEGNWAGFRDLSINEIDQLAKAIVVELKERGLSSIWRTS